MTPFHHGSKPFFRKIQIIHYQWVNFITATIPFSEKKILHHQWVNPPLRQSPTQKNTNNLKSVSQFHYCGNPLIRKIQIIHHHWINSTTKDIIYVEKYMSHSIINSIPWLRQSLIQKNTNHPKSLGPLHHCDNPLLRKTQIIQNQSVNSTIAATPY